METLLLSATKVCYHLDITARTLDLWYKWYELAKDKPKDTPILPPYVQKNKRGKRLWKSEDIKLLKEFKKWIPKGRGGIMGEFSQKYYHSKN